MNREWIVAFSLLSICFLLRVPFYFVDTIDWDESTFILMGQSLLDGHLPYLELWDLKPPLAFTAYAGFIILFGQSIGGIRLAGTLCVFIVSWLVYLIGCQIDRPQTGIIAGVLYVAASSLILSGQATMTEHVALVPLVGALAWSILQPLSGGVLLVFGALLTVATMIRLNLAYVVVAVGLWLVYGKYKQRVSWAGILAYCGGSFGIIFLTFLPYLITGNGKIWWDSVVLAPLSYSSGASIGLQLLACLLYGCSIRFWQGKSFEQRQSFSLLQVFLWGTVISILQGGSLFQHYYIQVFPFLTLTLILFWQRLSRKLTRWFLLGILVFWLALETEPIWTQYRVVGDRLLAKQPLVSGTGFEIADYLKQQNPPPKSVYLMKDHIAYWLADLQPLSKSTTHPSNISKEYLLPHIPGAETTTTDELARILAQKPELIIKPPEVYYLQSNTAAIALLETTLAREYQLVQRIGDRQVYKIDRIR